MTHLRRAVRANLALEHWPAACLSRNRLAQALAQRGAPGDAQDAAGERATAVEEAQRLGMALPEVEFATVPAPPGPGVAPVAEVTSTGIGPDEGGTPAGPPGVQVRLLGPLEVCVDGLVHPVLGQRRRTVLAVLALQAGELVGRLVGVVGGQLVEAIEQRAHLRDAVLDVAAHVLARVEVGLLLEQADAGARSELGDPVRGLRAPRHDPQERRLPGAVRADEADDLVQ